MTSDGSDERLWEDLCSAENTFYASRMRLFQNVVDFSGVLARALRLPHQRGTALRILEILPEERIRRHIDTLVDLASVAHSDLALVRSVLHKLDRAWLTANIDPIARPLLARGDEEEYRRIAEIYEELDPELLRVHLERCVVHASEEVRAVAEDFTASKDEQ